MKKTLSIILALTTFAGLLSGCRVTVHSPVGLSSFYYENAKHYTVGEASIFDKVDCVEIQWLTGKVTVTAHRENVIRFSEEANLALTDDQSVHFWLDGTTLRIQFCGSDEWNLNGMEKNLTVLLPDELLLKELKINCISANIEVDSVQAQQLNIHTMSGNLEMANCKITKKANFNTTSGMITAEMLGTMEELRVSTISGKASVMAQSIDTIDMDSISGNMLLSIREAPKKINVETVSGGIILILPEDIGMTLGFDTVSGRFFSELSNRPSGKYFVFGDGFCECSVETTSGHLSIQANMS